MQNCSLHPTMGWNLLDPLFLALLGTLFPVSAVPASPPTLIALQPSTDQPHGLNISAVSLLPPNLPSPNPVQNNSLDELAQGATAIGTDTICNPSIFGYVNQASCREVLDYIPRDTRPLKMGALNVRGMDFYLPHRWLSGLSIRCSCLNAKLTEASCLAR